MNDFPDTFWSLLFHDLLRQIPLVLVYIAGIVVGAVFWRRRGAPAMVVLIAFAVLVLGMFVLSIVKAALLDAFYGGKSESGELDLYFKALNYSDQFVHITSLGLLAWASLGWRAQSKPAGAAAASNSPAASVPLQPGATAPISKSFFLFTMFGAGLLSFLLLIPAFILMSQRKDSMQFLGLGIAGFSLLLSIFPVVMAYILIYKLWDTIKDGSVRTSPGKAVGFMFIPFFNFYWLFQVFWGWTVDFNAYTAERGIKAKRAPESLSLTLCILSFIPGVSLANIVLIWIYFSNAIDCANAVRSARALES